MDYKPIYFAETSALVKLLIDETGSEILRQFLAAEGILYTNALCFGEAFGVMKRKRFKEKTLTQEQYEGRSTV